MALFTLKEPKSSDSWEDVVAERQHISQEQLQADLQEYRRFGGSAAGALSDIPSSSCRKLVNELVKEENQLLMSVDRNHSWSMANVQVDWRTINRTTRRLRRVHVILELSPNQSEVAGRVPPRKSNREQAKDQNLGLDTLHEGSTQVVEPRERNSPPSERNTDGQTTLNSLPSGWFQATAEDGSTYYESFAGATQWQRPTMPAIQPTPPSQIARTDEQIF